MARIQFMNTEIDNLTMDEALAEIDKLIRQNRNAYVVTPNVDHLVQLERGGPLCDVYRDADLIVADGKPLIWISKWYGTPLKEKISGSDLFPRLCALAGQRGYSMFFLGAAEGVAAKAAENLKKRFPTLQIAGTYSPARGFEKKTEELEKIYRMINDAAPHILIVALGCPKQELFIRNSRGHIHVPLSLGLGATLDFEAGEVKRAPRWMADHGLEWLFRITQDPKRLAKRYLVDDMKIVGMAFKYRKQAKARKQR